jgi:hypothetical protein
MQLVAGRIGQEYNQRKNRRGAYWEDRYHATAVESDEHLAQYIVYIDIHPVKCTGPQPTLNSDSSVSNVAQGQSA